MSKNLISFVNTRKEETATAINTILDCLINKVPVRFLYPKSITFTGVIPKAFEEFNVIGFNSDLTINLSNESTQYESIPISSVVPSREKFLYKDNKDAIMYDLVGLNKIIESKKALFEVDPTIRLELTEDEELLLDLEVIPQYKDREITFQPKKEMIGDEIREVIYGDKILVDLKSFNVPRTQLNYFEDYDGTLYDLMNITLSKTHIYFNFFNQDNMEDMEYHETIAMPLGI